jgi:tetratricopeptide (TPR) repeat protein
MYHGLHRYKRAIEILLIAHGKGLLDDAQQIVLVDHLHARERYAESIPILEPLIERKPDQISYRTRLMVAYYHAKRPEQLRQLLTATDEHFRTAELWNESILAQLAETTLKVQRFSESIAYYEELIALHQRTAPNRGIAGGTLSQYYSLLAQAYSALGKTEQAVDAASAGIVAWGPRHDQRQSAISWLHQVLADAKDLDVYVKLRDQQAEKTGQDSPLIRQQIGTVYSRRGEHDKAIEQYQIALKLQPNDLETHRQLIASYKAVDNQPAVIEQTLALLDLDRHNLQLYKDLAEQLKADEALAERAATTLVEAAPNEAEHHQALAELRQQQDRWEEAIEQWQHVARLRSLEPTGLLKLAEAQLHEKRYEEGKRTLDKLRTTEWPSRFGSVQNQVDKLQRRIGQEQEK